MLGSPNPAKDRHEALWVALENAVEARGAGDLVGTLVANVRVAAQGDNADDRAWALVFMAATLRREGRADEAFDVLREAHALAEDEHVKVAAITVAMAIHCDLGNDEKARDLGQKAEELASDPYLLRVLGRAWNLGYRSTGIIDFRDEADSCFRRAESMKGLVGT